MMLAMPTVTKTLGVEMRGAMCHIHPRKDENGRQKPGFRCAAQAAHPTQSRHCKPVCVAAAPVWRRRVRSFSSWSCKRRCHVARRHWPAGGRWPWRNPLPRSVRTVWTSKAEALGLWRWLSQAGCAGTVDVSSRRPLAAGSTGQPRLRSAPTLLVARSSSPSSRLIVSLPSIRWPDPLVPRSRIRGRNMLDVT